MNLSNQQDYTDQIRPRLAVLKREMDLRKTLWDKLLPDKRKKWVQKAGQEKPNGDKFDPILDLSWDMYRYLRDNFFGEEFRDEI